jgi:hypothetical protein
VVPRHFLRTLRVRAKKLRNTGQWECLGLGKKITQEWYKNKTHEKCVEFRKLS